MTGERCFEIQVPLHGREKLPLIFYGRSFLLRAQVFLLVKASFKQQEKDEIVVHLFGANHVVKFKSEFHATEFLAEVSNRLSKKRKAGGTEAPRLPVVCSPVRPQSSQSDSSRRNDLKERGLCNLGNTCYLNAVAQALSSLREFKASLKTMKQSVPAMCKGELFLRTTELLECTGSPVPTQSPFSPTQLRDRIAVSAPKYGEGGQQDAHEFFLEWVNQLHDEMLACSKQWAREDPAQSDEQAGLALATQQHFDSKLEKRLVCESCGDHKDRTEKFRGFSLGFGQGEWALLPVMLESYFENERVDCKCDLCGCRSTRIEKTLTSAPRVLVLHLKRFVSNLSKQCYEKKHCSVFIHEKLDLSEYVGCFSGAASWAVSPAASPQRTPARPLAAEARSGAPMASLSPASPGSVPGAETPPPCAETPSPRASANAGATVTPPPVAKAARHSQTEASALECDAGPQDPGLVYDLRSIVSHEGESPNQGHYVSYARSEKGAWRLYDDAQVKDVSSIQKAGLGGSAYILFYVLRGGAAGA